MKNMYFKKIIKTSKSNSAVFFIFSFMLLVIIYANSQTQTIFYDSIKKQKYALIDVHKTYERVIEKGYDSIEMFEYLGNYYYKDKDFHKSKLYFDMLVKKYKLSDIAKIIAPNSKINILNEKCLNNYSGNTDKINKLNIDFMGLEESLNHYKSTL